jgi:hypothetical protein
MLDWKIKRMGKAYYRLNFDKDFIDLILPKIFPSAHTAIYDVERFLAVQIKLAQPKS